MTLWFFLSLILNRPVYGLFPQVEPGPTGS